MLLEPVLPEEKVGTAVTVVPVGTNAQAKDEFPEFASSAATPFIKQDDSTDVVLPLAAKTMKRFAASVDVALLERLPLPPAVK